MKKIELYGIACLRRINEPIEEKILNIVNIVDFHQKDNDQENWSQCFEIYSREKKETCINSLTSKSLNLNHGKKNHIIILSLFGLVIKDLYLDLSITNILGSARSARPTEL